MNVVTLKEAIQYAQKLKTIFITTADAQGKPHLSTVGNITLTLQGHVQVTDWLCQNSLANLIENRHLSLVVWNPNEDIGYQLAGEMEEMDKVGGLDKHVLETGAKSAHADVQWQLVVRVDRVIEFKKAPHVDAEVKI